MTDVRYCHGAWQESPTCYERALWAPMVGWANDVTRAFQRLAETLDVTTATLADMFREPSGPRTELRTDAFGWVRLDPSVAYRLEARIPGRLRRVEGV